MMFIWDFFSSLSGEIICSCLRGFCARVCVFCGWVGVRAHVFVTLYQALYARMSRIYIISICSNILLFSPCTLFEIHIYSCKLLDDVEKDAGIVPSKGIVFGLSHLSSYLNFFYLEHTCNKDNLH